MNLNSEEITEALSDVINAITQQRRTGDLLQQGFSMQQKPTISLGSAITIIIIAVTVALFIGFIGINTKTNAESIHEHKISVDSRLSEISLDIKNGFDTLTNSQKELSINLQAKEEKYIEEVNNLRDRSNNMEQLIGRLALKINNE